MRIVAGQYRGRRLNVPQNQDIRPTTDKIRGAVFNMLNVRGAVIDSIVLDAFCGTGALGLEALSRGASHATFVDQSQKSLELARGNAKILGEKKVNFIKQDSAKAISAEQGYDLVFLDPPYNKGLVSVALKSLCQNNSLAENAWIVCETEKHCAIEICAGCTYDGEKTYGDIKITILRYNA